MQSDTTATSASRCRTGQFGAIVTSQHRWKCAAIGGEVIGFVMRFSPVTLRSPQLRSVAGFRVFRRCAASPAAVSVPRGDHPDDGGHAPHRDGAV
ncbi:MAG: hypothetical protein QOJ52_3952, partial [Acidimicrobiaceae bacterium]|nr:hypothetical protein [Acidimicrobiaceae bacterium]